MSRDKWDRSACEREIANCELQIANFKFEEGEAGRLKAEPWAELRCKGFRSDSCWGSGIRGQGKRWKPRFTCLKCASPVKTSVMPSSCMTTNDVKSTNEMSGLS